MAIIKGTRQFIVCKGCQKFTCVRHGNRVLCRSCRRIFARARRLRWYYRHGQQRRKLLKTAQMFAQRSTSPSSLAKCRGQLR